MTNNYQRFHYVRECIEERLRTYCLDRTWFSQEALWLTFDDLLNSAHNYKYYGRHLCQLSENAVELRTLTQGDLKKVWMAMEPLWPLPDKCMFTETYVQTCIYGNRNPDDLKSCVKHHIKIIEALFMITYCESYDVTCLLSLSYWIFLYSNEKKERHRRTRNNEYNDSTIHALHKDLVITFLALNCRFPPPDRRTVTVIGQIPQLPPNFAKIISIIHHGISPKHTSFLRLVLQQMLKFFKPNMKFCDMRQQTIGTLIGNVYKYLSEGRWLWTKKGYQGIEDVIRDQTRYLALWQPILLHQHFVADKIRRELSAITRQLLRDNIIDNIRNKITLHTCKALEIFHGLQILPNDDGRYLPTARDTCTCMPDTKILNSLHHLILVDICTDLLGYRCPRVTSNFWFVGDNFDFVQFLRSLAKEVYDCAFQTPDKDRQALYFLIAKIAIALQQIIAARWYVTEVKQSTTNGITTLANKKLVDHQEIVFILLAFRALMMYILPQNPWTKFGVHRANFPQYGQNLKFYLPLLFFDKHEYR